MSFCNFRSEVDRVFDNAVEKLRPTPAPEPVEPPAPRAIETHGENRDAGPKPSSDFHSVKVDVGVPPLALQDHQAALKWARDEALLAYIRTGNAVGAIGVLSDGADPDATTKWGASALHLTCVDPQDYTDKYYENVRAGSTRIAAELLAKGADVNVKDRGGATPLHKAIRLHDNEMVELFLANKVRLDLTDEEGNTLLHIAAGLKGARGREITKALLDASGTSQLVAKNLQGLTPVDIARGWEGDQSIALLLAEALDKAEE